MVGQRRTRWANISPTLGQQSWCGLDIFRPVSFPSNKFVKRFIKTAAIVNVLFFSINMMFCGVFFKSQELPVNYIDALHCILIYTY